MVCRLCVYVNILYVRKKLSYALRLNGFCCTECRKTTPGNGHARGSGPVSFLHIFFSWFLSLFYLSLFCLCMSQLLFFHSPSTYICILQSFCLSILFLTSTSILLLLSLAQPCFFAIVLQTITVCSNLNT